MREVRDRYEIFLKVCETGNFTKAAEALNYTQSGISQMMAGLEEELGVQLFARAKKGVVLTDNGQRLIPYIREMVNQKEKLRQAAFNINNKVEGRLRIGSFSSVTAMWLPHVVHFFKENYPQVEVQIDQLGGRRGIDHGARRDDLAQTLAALEHDERAGLGARHIRAGGNGRGDRSQVQEMPSKPRVRPALSTVSVPG